MDQKRFLLALILSAIILFGWSYFAGRKTPPPQNANSAQANPTPTSPTIPANNSDSPQQSSAGGANFGSFADGSQQRLTIKTPLYEAKFDSKGAVATSWVITHNKRTGQPLYSVAGNHSSRLELQLIPSSDQLLRSVAGQLQQDALSMPLRLLTGDEGFDALLSSKNYQLVGVEGGGDVNLDLKAGEMRSVSFVLRDEAGATEIVKKLTFAADSYTVGLDVKVTRGGQTLPSVKLAIGPSIGDQGVPQYNFYSVAPGAVAVVNGKAQQVYASEVHSNESSKDRQLISGPIDWAAIGDTYFAMAAVPPRPADSLEIRTVKYEHDANGSKEERFLITAYVSIPADGSTTRIYAGPKDHKVLTDASTEISGVMPGRTVDLDGLINFGWFGFVARPLAAPILWSFEQLHKLTNSYGIAIILFTIIIYSLFFPLKWRSSKSMKKAQKLAPKMKELQEKIKGMKSTDPRLKELQAEQLRLMKEGNPLGGCLPLLLQMPFLIAVYTAITISLDFRQASFLWIPDLSSAEPYTIHLLPILMAGSMVFLQFITPTPTADPMQRQQRMMMMILMPIFMLYILWSAPSGLLVYWIVGNFVGFAQQLIINRLVKTEDDQEPQPPSKKVETRRAKKLDAARA